MNPSLAEALAHLDLQPGRTYRETVNGRTIEVRVLDDEPTPELAAQVMLQPWVDFPFTPRLTIQAEPGKLPPPDPPGIPEEDEM
jgi:hypothetical protein